MAEGVDYAVFEFLRRRGAVLTWIQSKRVAGSDHHICADDARYFEGDVAESLTLPCAQADQRTLHSCDGDNSRGQQERP